MGITEEDYAALLRNQGKSTPHSHPAEPEKRHKYNAKRKTVDGHTFASTAEALRYHELRMSELAGLITNLQLQVPYEIDINGVHVCTYIADFVYQKDGHLVVEDVKGVLTPVYRLKKKLLSACHGIEISEVKRKGSSFVCAPTQQL